MEVPWDKAIGRPIIGHAIVSYTRAGIRVSGVQYAQEHEMFGANEDLARTLHGERMRAADCQGARREWCRLEYTKVKRHG